MLFKVIQTRRSGVRGSRLRTYLLGTPTLGLPAVRTPRLQPAWGHQQWRRGGWWSSPEACWNSWRSSSRPTPVVAMQDATRKKKRWRCNLGPKSENHRYLIPSQLRTMVLGSGWIYSLDSSALLSHLASPVNTILTLNCCQGCQSVPWVKNHISFKYIPSEDIFGYHIKIFFFSSMTILTSLLLDIKWASYTIGKGD